MTQYRKICICFSMVAVLVSGCNHTLPNVNTTRLAAMQTGKRLGVEYVFDLHQFNYADAVRAEAADSRCFTDVVLTHNVGDPACDYVLRANFSYYNVCTHSQGYYASIYLLFLPLLVGVPYEHFEGQAAVTFELYHKGVLHKSYSYEDTFWGEKGLLTPSSAPTIEKELKRATRVCMLEIMRDFFGYEDASL